MQQRVLSLRDRCFPATSKVVIQAAFVGLQPHWYENMLSWRNMITSTAVRQACSTRGSVSTRASLISNSDHDVRCILRLQVLKEAQYKDMNVHCLVPSNFSSSVWEVVAKTLEYFPPSLMMHPEVSTKSNMPVLVSFSSTELLCWFIGNVLILLVQLINLVLSGFALDVLPTTLSHLSPRGFQRWPVANNASTLTDFQPRMEAMHGYARQFSDALPKERIIEHHSVQITKGEGSEGSEGSWLYNVHFDVRLQGLIKTDDFATKSPFTGNTRATDQSLTGRANTHRFRRSALVLNRARCKTPREPNTREKTPILDPQQSFLLCTLKCLLGETYLKIMFCKYGDSPNCSGWAGNQGLNKMNMHARPLEKWRVFLQSITFQPWDFLAPWITGHFVDLQFFGLPFL